MQELVHLKENIRLLFRVLQSSLNDGGQIKSTPTYRLRALEYQKYNLNA
jgi:hypothetical protein